jgi:2-oxoglutarate ferredoxin oxidoreductase subunit alpha
MSDLDLGMNTWMSDPFRYPEKALDRGKVLDADALTRLGGEWGRYRDVDGDGIPYRTVPGTGMPAYFTRGSGHNARGQYSERPDDYQDNVDRLLRKFATAKQYVPGPVVDESGTEVGVIGYGTSHWAIEESRDQMSREAGLATSYMRVRAYPFTGDVEQFIERHRRVYVVEQNRDAQLRALMKIDMPAELAGRLRSVLHYNGLPIDARSITDEILVQEGLKTAEPRKAEMAQGVAVGGE